MMMKLALLTALVGGISAFALSSSTSSSSSSWGSMSALNAEMSKSLPFLLRPSNLDGTMIGDVGFDPIGLSDNFDLKWLREAELKHGRVSMLAVVGFVVSEFVNFPMYSSMHVDDSNMAPSVVGLSAMLQIVFAAGIEEYRTNKGNITFETMFVDPDRVPREIWALIRWGTSRRGSTTSCN
jgi:light-harvesting complex I chlorophyll a/b binding protein 4